MLLFTKRKLLIQVQNYFNMAKKIDYFNINPDVTPEESLEEKFRKEREEWSDKIESMSKKMRDIMEIPTLMTDLYTERQRCVDYYHYLISLAISVNKRYRSEYASRQDYYNFKSQVRFPNESSKDNRIKVDLANLLETRETLDNHTKFIDKTIGTIDNIIFAIPRRVEIEQISRGK